MHSTCQHMHIRAVPVCNVMKYMYVQCTCTYMNTKWQIVLLTAKYFTFLNQGYSSEIDLLNEYYLFHGIMCECLKA